MLKGIVVGVDGSPFSASALELGIRWAKRFDLMLVGQAAIDQASICRNEAVPLGAGHFKQEQNKALLADAQRKAELFLEQFAIRCADEHVSCKLLEDEGDPSQLIELAAQRFDLVLLGKETRFTFETQMDPDDTLVRVLRDGPRPVVSVPLTVHGTGPIVVAYDGSAQSARALQAFEATGLANDAELHVVSVAPKHLEAARTADRAMQFLSLHGHRPQSVPVESTSQPAQVILEHAQRLKAQLLVMGAYGQQSIREFFLGTVTRLVLKNASVPVFLQH